MGNAMIKLHAQITVTKQYSGKSKFPFWSEMKPGCLLSFSIKLEPIGGGRGGKYATNIDIVRIQDNDITVFTCSIDECCNYLSKIEYI